MHLPAMERLKFIMSISTIPLRSRKALIKPSADSTIPADKPLISPDSAGAFVAYDLLAPNNDIYGAYIQKLIRLPHRF